MKKRNTCDSSHKLVLLIAQLLHSSNIENNIYTDTQKDAISYTFCTTLAYQMEETFVQHGRYLSDITVAQTLRKTPTNLDKTLINLKK